MADEETHEQPPRLPRATTGWLRGVLARRARVTRPISMDDASDLDAAASPTGAGHASDASAPRDPLSRATRAGEVIAALAPGAPPGLIAPEGAPRVPHTIGRDAALANALAQLASGVSLCVQSDGTPGVGKTTFAAELAARAAEQRIFTGGCVWIACETLSGDTGLAEIISRVARALRLERALAALDPTTRRLEVANALADMDHPAVLVALDDLEPTLDTVVLLDTLLGGAATLLLTTSQPLADSRIETCVLAPLSPVDARALFAERLRLRDVRRPTPEEEPLVGEVAEALAGAPLALELTASQAGVYGVTLDVTVAEALADGARAPVAGLRGRLDRHWRALSTAQGRAVGGLTLIQGATFPRAVALAVTSAALDLADLTDLVDTPSDAAQSLDALVGLGLVEALAAGRLRLHGRLRQRVAPRLGELDAATQTALGEAMAAWWLTYAQGRRGYEGLAGLEAEAAGLMGAVTWAHAHERWRLALDLAEALDDAWRAHGRRDEALRIGAWAVEAAEAVGSLGERLWARYQLAVAQTEAGRATASREGFAAALELARELDDPQAIRDCAHALAALAARAGDDERARSGFREALELARALDDAATIRDELHGLAILDARAGALELARAEYAEALELARAVADPASIYLERYGLALIELRQGAVEQARAGFTEAAELARELGDADALMDTLSSLGALEAQHGEPAAARVALSEALGLAEQLRDARRAARTLVWLGELEAATGGDPAASERFAQARALYERLGDAEAVRVAERMQALGYAS